MFAKRDSAAFFSNPFEPLQMDLTNPNLQFNGLKSSKLHLHYYHEKKIIELLQQEVITEKEYQKLFLLTHIPIPAEHCIAQDCWLPIANLLTFDEFKSKEAELKSSLLARFEFIKNNARFIYKTPNHEVYLLANDMDRLDNRLIELLAEKTIKSGSFNLADLMDLECTLKKEMYSYAKQTIQSDDDKFIFEFTQLNSSQLVVDVNAFNLYQNYRKSLSDGLPLLLSMIVKMRFFTEFDEPANGHALQRQLENMLFREAVKRKGFDLLQGSPNHTKRKRIQDMLNQLIFEESGADEVQRLIQLGADPNAVNNEQTVLGEALLFGQGEKALQLLLLGAEPDFKPSHSQDQSNLMMALNHLMPEKLIQELIKGSKNLNYKNRSGETALIVAVQKKAAFSLVMQLIENTKDINALTNQGYRAIDFVIRDNTQDGLTTIKKLIAAGASLRLRNDDGNLPLIEAANCCNLPAVKYFFQEAPDLLEECNHKGETALLVVLNNGHCSQEACEIIDFLMKNGAHPGVSTKEGKSGFMLAKKFPLLQNQLDKTFQEMTKYPLSQDQFLIFTRSLASLMNNNTHRLAGAAALLMRRYLSYLHGLEGGNTPRSNASLLTQIIFLQKQPDFTLPYLNKILDDIKTGGEAHQALLKDNPDLIDRFSRIDQDLPRIPQKLPLNLRSSRTFIESKQLNLGESAYLFNKLEDFLKNECLELGEDFALILSDPRFWALPKETLKLIYENQTQFKQLIKDWGLRYDQLRELSQKKLLLLSRFDKVLQDLKQKNIPLQEFIYFDEGRLNLVLENAEGLHALLNLNVSFERLRRMDINRLNLWLEHPAFLNFWCQHKLNIRIFLTMEVQKFNLLAGHLEQLTKWMELKQPFESLASLSQQEIADVLIEPQGLEERRYSSLF